MPTRIYQVLAVQFKPAHVEEHRAYEATSLSEALAMAEREDAGCAGYVYGIEPEDYALAHAEGIAFNEADGLLLTNEDPGPVYEEDGSGAHVSWCPCHRCHTDQQVCPVCRVRIADCEHGFPAQSE